MQKLSYTQKISLTAGSAALLAPAIGQAAVVHFDNTNAITVSYSGTTSAEWDVDGGGVNDFILVSFFSSFISLDSGGGRNGRGMVRTGSRADDVNALSNGFAVGATLAGGYNWGNPGQAGRTMLTSNSGVGNDFKGASVGSNFIGFRFDIAGDLHYGWAEIILGGAAVTINQWAYDDVADTSINVGAIGSPTVPEPSGLALLAAGAAGIATIRRRKAKAQKHA